MGRPRKYATEEQRQEARREQVRKNVIKFRQKKRVARAAAKTAPLTTEDEEKKSPSVKVLPLANGTESPEDEDVESVVTSERALSLDREVWRHTTVRPVDVYSLLPAVVEALERAVPGWPWASSLKLSLLEGDRLVDQAVLAAGTQFVGAITHNKSLQYLSFTAYQDVLQQLQRRTSVADSASCSGPLMNTVYMALEGTELGESLAHYLNLIKGREDKALWKAHYQAGVFTTELAGPLAYNSTLGLRVLRAQKSKIVFLALYHRKKCFLDDDDWRSIPYTLVDKSCEDEFWEFLERVPGLLERADKVHTKHASGQHMTTEAMELWQDMKAIRDKMRAFVYAQLPAEPRLIPSTGALLSGDIVRGVGAVSTKETVEGAQDLVCLFPESYVFVNKHIGFAMVFYWYYSMVLSATAMPLQRLIAESNSSHEQNSPEQYFAPVDLEEAATNICRSMEFLYARDKYPRREEHSHPSTLPLRTAMYYYSCQNEAAKVRWCLATSKSIQRDFGALRSEHFLDVLFGRADASWAVRRPDCRLL